MNHVYRLVWSHRRNGWVAVSELARGRKKGSGRRLTLAALSLTAAVAQAGPSGGQVVSGAGQISSSGNSTTVTQSSQNLSLNWQSFNIAPQETVDFVQPSAAAVAVNHILGNNGTQILGHLNANGQVYLINPNGILFGAGSQVDVGGLVASTLDVSATNSGSTTRSFSGSGTGSVINEGTITAANGGYVVLLGNRVNNLGTIVAQLGAVGFGAGSAVTLTFSGDSLVGMQVDRSTLNNLAANGGLVQADGGRVIMTAGAQNALLASVVNNTGVIEARTVEEHDGTITLLGGMTAGQVNVGGTLDASAPNGGNGGSIETSAAHVSVADSARITTAAPQGLTGSWMVDPQDFTVAASGGDITGATLSTELAATNVQLESSSGATSGSGNVNVNDPVTWSANTTLTLTASNNVNINASIAATGATAGLVIAPNTANGGEAASGAGVYTLNNGSSITLSGANPSLSIAGQAYTVINTLGSQGSTTATDLQGINGNLSGYYALGSNIGATATASWNSGAGFTPIGSPGAAFTGTFDGLGHTIGNLTINQTGRYVGLFGYVGSTGVVQNVGLVGGSVIGDNYTGALVGSNYGTVNNSYATLPVTGDFDTGGLVGQNYGTVKNSHATGAVSSSGYGTGGLIGISGTYNNSSATHISNSYATGAVTSTTAAVGGLAGVDYGSIDSSYATGSVASTSVSNPAEVGGLVGALVGPVTNSYATGHVSAGTFQVGGLVGVVYSFGGADVGTVTNSFWNVTTTGQSSSAGGGTGLTTAQMQTAANFTGFNFSTTPGATGNNWVMVDADGTLNNAGGSSGATYPMLASEYATTITNAHQLQLMAMDTAASYALGANIDASATAGSGDVWSTSNGFSPVGPSSAPFSGTFNGLGHTISGLYIVTSPQNGSGMFGASTGTLENVGLVNENMTGGPYRSGGLVGENGGVISNSYVTGSVTAGFYTGGLAGINGGTITNSYSTATVNGGGNVGGLVGGDYGTITESYATGAVAGSFRVGGLAGFNIGGAVSNSYSTGTVSGSSAVGGLLGANYGPVSGSHASGPVTGSGGSSDVGGLIGSNFGTVSDSYATNFVNGSSNVGGLVGYNYGRNSSGTTVSNSYATGDVSGTSNVGGLVGYNYAGGSSGSSLAAVSNSYATGAVAGSNNVGGLVGYNYAGTGHGMGMPLTTVVTVDDSYATGAVSGSTNVGGLVGNNSAGAAGDSATVSNGFWNVTTTGQSTSSGGGTGLTTAQMQQQSNFTGWDFAATWISYNGYTNPLLQSFMTPLTVTANDATGTYNGVAYTGGNGVTYSVTPGGNLLGSLTYGGSSQGAVNVGNYSLTPQGLYSNQQGYIISYTSGALTITPAPLTVTGTTVGNKVYDGTTTAALTGGTLSGLVGSESLTLTQTGVFASANVGTGIAVTASDTLSGAAASNYTFTQPTDLTGNITPAPLTIVGTSVANKVYDGTTTATLTGGRLLGLVGTDPVGFAQAGSFASSNAGNGIAVTAADTLAGTAAANYTLTQPTGLTANITPAPLTVSGTTVANKVYDGTATATLNGGTLSGIVGSDSVALTQAGAFAAVNAGTGIAVNASDTLNGAGASNYVLTQPTGLTANITPATLTYVALPESTSSGKVASNLSGTVSGFIAGDTLANSTSGTPAWITNATTASPPGAYAIDGGGLTAGNYVFVQDPNNATALTVAAAAPPAPPAPPVAAAPVTPPSVAWLETSVLPVSASSTSLTFNTPQTAIASNSAPVSASASTTSTNSSANSSNSSGGNSSGGYNGQVFETTADFGGGKLRVENGGVKLPDSPPGAH
jgi:filamentous hemagglutinin family protein